MSDLLIGKYRVDPILFEQGFAKGCGPFQCRTSCCHSGVFVDPSEMETILRHKEEVKAQMDETQVTDESAWFEKRYEDDIDFPSGTSIGTEVHNGKCTFLRKDGRCSIQLVSAEKYDDPWKIKPFYCIAFPIVVIDGLLTFDDYQQDNASCCSIVRDTETSLVESCKAELEFVLGEEGYRQLAAMKNSFDSKKEMPQ